MTKSFHSRRNGPGLPQQLLLPWRHRDASMWAWPQTTSDYSIISNWWTLTSVASCPRGFNHERKRYDAVCLKPNINAWNDSFLGPLEGVAQANIFSSMKVPYVLFLAWLFLVNVNVHGFIALTRRQHKMMSKEWQNKQSASPINTARSRLFELDSYIEKIKRIVETKSTDTSSLEKVWEKSLK